MSQLSYTSSGADRVAAVGPAPVPGGRARPRGPRARVRLDGTSHLRAPRVAMASAAAASLAMAACGQPIRVVHPVPVSASTAHVPTPSRVTTIDDVGFDGPENLVYDEAADVFLVSNMGGGGSARDDNGFISRVSPDGRVMELRWIAGGRSGVVLHAPKGLAIRGDTLAVADLGAVRLFDRRTGAPLDSIAVPGVVMNDLAFARDGSLWITDTGPSRDRTPVDTAQDMDAVWRVTPDGRVHAVARGLALDRPDGIVVDSAGVLVATFGANRLERVRVGTRGGATPAATLPGRRVDGLRRLPDGSLVVSSWEAKAVWRLTLGSAPRELLADVTSPAGLAVDTRRHRLAVTSVLKNALYVIPIR